MFIKEPNVYSKRRICGCNHDPNSDSKKICAKRHAPEVMDAFIKLGNFYKHSVEDANAHLTVNGKIIQSEENGKWFLIRYKCEHPGCDQSQTKTKGDRFCREHSSKPISKKTKEMINNINKRTINTRKRKTIRDEDSDYDYGSVEIISNELTNPTKKDISKEPSNSFRFSEEQSSFSQIPKATSISNVVIPTPERVTAYEKPTKEEFNELMKMVKETSDKVIHLENMISAFQKTIDRGFSHIRDGQYDLMDQIRHKDTKRY